MSSNLLRILNAVPPSPLSGTVNVSAFHVWSNELDFYVSPQKKSSGQ